MGHYGILCPPTSDHLNPLAALGRTLRTRGHRVTMFQLPDLRAHVEREGLEFWPLGEGQAEAGWLAASVEQLSRMSGFPAIRFTIECASKLAALVLRTAPEALRRAGVSLALIDQNEPAGASAAEYLGIPFVSVAALPLNREPGAPPTFATWESADTLWARARNRIGYMVTDRLLAPITAVLNGKRRQWHLPVLKTPDDSFSRLAQLCVMPRTLDSPRRELPPYFHYVGPFVDKERKVLPFPWTNWMVDLSCMLRSAHG